MVGSLRQLVAYGAQDIYLTGNSQITFVSSPNDVGHKVEYLKVSSTSYSNDDLKTVELRFDTNAVAGNKVVATVYSHSKVKKLPLDTVNQLVHALKKHGDFLKELKNIATIKQNPNGLLCLVLKMNSTEEQQDYFDKKDQGMNNYLVRTTDGVVYSSLTQGFRMGLMNDCQKRLSEDEVAASRNNDLNTVMGFLDATETSRLWSINKDY